MWDRVADAGRVSRATLFGQNGEKMSRSGSNKRQPAGQGPSRAAGTKTGAPAIRRVSLLLLVGVVFIVAVLMVISLVGFVLEPDPAVKAGPMYVTLALTTGAALLMLFTALNASFLPFLSRQTGARCATRHVGDGHHRYGDRPFDARGRGRLRRDAPHPQQRRPDVHHVAERPSGAETGDCAWEAGWSACLPGAVAGARPTTARRAQTVSGPSSQRRPLGVIRPVSGLDPTPSKACKVRPRCDMDGDSRCVGRR
jgi:hypothetical protein